MFNYQNYKFIFVKDYVNTNMLHFLGTKIVEIHQYALLCIINGRQRLLLSVE